MMMSWSDLHEDLLILITRKLQSIKDKLSFRSVCVSWCSASKADSLDGTRQLPWLLLASRENLHIHKKYLCDFTYKRLYKTTELSDKCKSRWVAEWCLGWKGWFVAENYGAMCLRHAFKKTTPISLPELPAYAMLSKAVLSSDPFMNASDYTLAMIYGVYNRLAVWRPGDESYTGLEVDGILDAIFDGGLLYATSWTIIYVFDIVAAGCNLITTYQIHEKIPRNSYGWRCYLLKMGGDMMFLDFAINNGPSNCQFNVYLVSELSKWKEVKDLGNRAVFVGSNSQSFAMDNASEIQGCMPNHIYFTSSGSNCYARVYAYNLANGKVDFDCAACEEDFRCFHEPLWVQPVID